MKIGKRLKELRKKKEITLEELSKKSGVALATLSRMENDKMPGTLRSHTRICKILGVSIAELYRELEDGSKTVESVPRSGRTEHFIHAKKARYELLVTKAMNKKLMPLIIHIEAGGSTQSEQNKTGVEKFIYMMKGTMEAAVGAEKYTLKPGDSLYFEASLPHTFRNNTRSDVEAICVISPPAL